MTQLYFKGTIIEAYTDISYKKERRRFILVESPDNEQAFLLVCISGYDSGSIFGYIKMEKSNIEKNILGVSKEHLIKELKQNLQFEDDSLQIENKPKF